MPTHRQDTPQPGHVGELSPAEERLAYRWFAIVKAEGVDEARMYKQSGEVVIRGMNSVGPAERVET